MNLIFVRNEEKFKLEPLEQAYLFGSLLRFCLAHEPDTLGRREFTLQGELPEQLHSLLESSLLELLEIAYEDPPERQRQRHPTRFDAFIVGERRYVVNYTTSKLGRLMYLLALRTRLIREGWQVTVETDLPGLY